MIYRYSVSNNQCCTVKEIDFYKLSVLKGNEIIEEFYE